VPQSFFVRAYAVVTCESPEAIEVFLDRSAPDAFVAECLIDEPDWKDLLRVVRSN
jgi:hypothetical protein